ncbi:hypothetical protein Y032_0252g242 [Ancylostoma ceylanicum]|uniref:Uncharacterized protein n=2 Tax=Ancylostoma ceylanicum TaxID=53326 RepID=A0A016SBV3_9BILA|nr:hypothetical protein Y032_0252g242 [Ancylostoma ceylanicum]
MMTDGASASPNGSQETRREHWADSFTKYFRQDLCHIRCKSPGIVRYGGVVVPAKKTANRKGPSKYQNVNFNESYKQWKSNTPSIALMAEELRGCSFADGSCAKDEESFDSDASGILELFIRFCYGHGDATRPGSLHHCFLEIFQIDSVGFFRKEQKEVFAFAFEDGLPQHSPVMVRISSLLEIQVALT